MSDSLMFFVSSIMVLQLPMYFLIFNKKQRDRVKWRVFGALVGIMGIVVVLLQGIIQANVT